MPFKGHFDSFFISKIFQFLNEENKTGVLTLESGDNKANILLYDGVIVYVQGCNQEHRLGRYFVREGVLSEEDLTRILEMAGRNNKSFGKILIESKFTTVKDLKCAIKKQATEILFEVFTWESGEFNFEDTEIDPRRMVFFELNVMKLIFDAARRLDEMQLFERNIESEDVVLRISEKIKKQQTITLDAEAWQILSLIDGRRSVREIVELSDYGRFDVYKVLNATMSVDMLEVARDASEKSQGAGQAKERQEEDAVTKKNKGLFSLFMKK